MTDRPQTRGRWAPGSAAEPSPSPAAGDDAGPGWYASTWDLQQGLDVSEGLPADAAPLEELMAYLLTQQAADAALTQAPREDAWAIGTPDLRPDGAAAPLNPRRRRPRVP